MNYLNFTAIDQIFNNNNIIELTKNDNTLILKEIVSQLMFVITGLPGIVYWKNKDGVYLGHNNFTEEYRQKYQWPSNIIGKTDRDLFSHSLAEEHRREDMEVMLYGNKIIKEEIGCLSTGEKYIQLSCKQQLKDEREKIVGVIGSLIDITSIKDTREQLTSNWCIDHIKNKKIKSDLLHTLQKHINEPLKEVLLLTNLLTENDNKHDNLMLISEIKHFIKTLLSNYNYILNGKLDVAKM